MYTKRGDRVPLEAAALTAAASSGVVELVDAVGGVLRTRWVEGRTLAAVGPLPADEVAGLTAAVASTVADLHDRGVVHGGIDPTHVLVTAEGRPVLCSLGRGGNPADDVAAIGAVLAGLVATVAPPAGAPTAGSGRPRALGAMLAPPAAAVLADLASAAQSLDPAERPTARALAAAIKEQVPGARLPRPPTPSLLSAERAVPRPATGRQGRRGPSPRRWLALGAGAAIAAGVVSTVLVVPSPPGGGTHPAVTVLADDAPPTAPTTTPTPTTTPAPTTTTVPAPVATQVWPTRPLDLRDGVLTTEDGTRYRLGQAGDTAVTGDWSCSGRATVALLRPATGEVFAFDDWAQPGRDVVARPVGQVPGATALEAADVDGDGCTDLLATAPDSAPVAVPAVRP